MSAWEIVVPDVTITPEQRKAIDRQAAIYGTDDTPDVVGLIYYEVLAASDGMFGEPAPEGALEVHFRYRYSDEDKDGKGGLEVTVFAADGSVVTSQDFG